MNKTVISIVNTLIFCFWNSGDLRAEETDVKSLPPIQFAEGEKRFTAVNQKRVDIVKQIPGLVALWDFVQRRDSWKTKNPFISIPESLGDRLMNSNRETYRLIFGMREKKRRLKISSCMVGDPLDKPSAFRVLAVQRIYRS